MVTKEGNMQDIESMWYENERHVKDTFGYCLSQVAMLFH